MYRDVTRCRGCQQESEMSSKEHAFYELTLQPSEGGTLHQSLWQYLSEEQLDGANQYDCSSCGSKQDATCKIVLGKLPDTLFLQLMRFKYEEGTRKKLRHSFSFPTELDMAPYEGDLEQPPEGGSDFFELVTVLIHTGSSANVGHYIAHIRDQCNRWWKFNDEAVTPLHKKDLGEKAEATAETATSKKKKASAKKGKKRKVEADDTAATGDDTLPTSSGEPTHAPPQTLGGPASSGPGAAAATAAAPTSSAGASVRTSTNAYMLVYRRRPATAAAAGAEECPEPIADLQQQVERCNETSRAQLQDYTRRVEEEQRRIEDHKKRYESVMHQVALQDDDAPTASHCWISKAALRSWVRGDTLKDLHTLQEELVCPHDRLRPFPAAKLVPTCVWDAVGEHQRRCCGQSGGAGPGMPVSRPFSSWNRPILTEIYYVTPVLVKKY
jgi:hypothetical protein